MTPLRLSAANRRGLAVIVALACLLHATSALGLELEAVKAAIRDSGAAWVAADTSVSGLSETDKARLVGLQPEDFLDESVPTAPTARTLFRATFTAPLPDRLDWRNFEGDNYVTPPKHQGLCGACWAFAGIAALESRVLLDTHQPGLNLDLAEQALLSCDSVNGCDGGTGSSAARNLRDKGATTEACQPYAVNDTEPCNTDCDRTYAISSYQRILPVPYPEPTPTSAEMIEILKQHLALYGPLWTSMQVYDEFYDYASGIYAITGSPGEHQGGHAILLVGYDEIGEAFIVKNSWGTGWGESGFFRIAYGEVNTAVEFGATTYAYGDPVDLLLEPPTADAGENRTVAEAQTVTLDGTGSSDPDGQIDHYEWRQIGVPAVTLADGTSARPSFVTPNLTSAADAELVFELTVTDDDGLTATDRVTVTVTWTNDAPTARAGADRTVAEGASVILDGSPSEDPEGEACRYRWVQVGGPSVDLSGAASSQASFTAPNLTSAGDADLVFRLAVTDPHDSRDTDRVTITVNWANDPPRSNAGEDHTVAEGTAVRLDGTASEDQEGEALSYRWRQISGPTVTLADAATGQAGFTAPNLTSAADARLIFELTVTDPHNDENADRVAITVRWENDAPTAAAGTDQAVSAGDSVSLDGNASSDPDDGIQQYTWNQVAGPSVVLSTPNASTTSFIAPANATAADLELRFELLVSDRGGLSASDSVQIRVAPQTPPREDPTPPTAPSDPQDPEAEVPPSDNPTDNAEEAPAPRASSSGGGGGGCFISTSAAPQPTVRQR